MSGRIAIVGAGISGLCAGVYARFNGYEVDIYEANSLPGGMCTAWKRNGFTFDGCIHWLTGSRPGSRFHALWEEVGAVQGRSFVYPDAYLSTVGRDGRRFTLWTDVNRLEAHMLELAPRDAEASRHFCRLIRALGKLDLRMDKAFELYGVRDVIRALLALRPAAREWSYASRITQRTFAARFTDPLIRRSIENAILPDMALAPLLMTMADLHKGNAGYPVGGSLPFARAIADRCLELGGRIHYGWPVKRVRVRSGRACGLELEHGGIIDADLVISAADLRRNLDVLLEGRFPSPRHEKLFCGHRLYPACAWVFFGVNRVFEEGICAVDQVIELEESIQISGRPVQWLRWKNYAIDPTLAPPGKSVIAAGVETDHAWWNALGRGSEAYRQAKADLAAGIQRALDRALPGFSTAVEVLDVATPLTFERYTHSYEGRFMTWVPDANNAREIQAIPRTVPDLKRFYMVGMWLMGPGGLPPALKTARDAVQVICHAEGVAFRTRAPDGRAIAS